MNPKFVPYDVRTVREWVAFQQTTNATWQAAEGRVVRVSGVQRGITGVYHFSVTVPEGKLLLIQSRNLKLTSGKFQVEVLSAPGTMDGSLMTVRNIFSGQPRPVESVFRKGVQPVTPITVEEEDFVDSGTATGNSRPATTGSGEETPVFATGTLLVRVTPDQSGAYTASLRLLAWELDV